MLYSGSMVKIGVIGLGSMGKNHARVCSEIPNVELIGVADVDPTTVHAIADRFQTKGYTDYNKLLPHIDAAIIATPTNTHYEIASKLIKNEKHLLIEKPITDSVNNAKKLIQDAEKHQVTIAVGHIEKHNPVVNFVKEGLTSKKFGELIALTSKRVSNLPTRIKDVGVIFDFGVHDIDIMRYLAGDIISVYARAGTFNKNITHEDHAHIVLNFKNGITGIIQVNWLTPMKIRKLSLTCSNCFVEADYINQSATISSSSFTQINENNLYHVPIQYNINEISLQRKEPLRNEIEDFITAMTKNIKPLATGEDGLKTIEVAEAATQSYKKGTEVRLI